MLSGLLPDAVSARATASSGSPFSGWPTLLIIDSDDALRRTLVHFFETRGFHVAAGTTFAEAKEFIHRRKNWTLIVADYHLADATGAELCEWLKDQKCHAPVLLTSGSPHRATLCAGRQYLAKPFTIERLEAYVRTVR